MEGMKNIKNENYNKVKIIINIYLYPKNNNIKP